MQEAITLLSFTKCEPIKFECELRVGVQPQKCFLEIYMEHWRLQKKFENQQLHSGKDYPLFLSRSLDRHPILGSQAVRIWWNHNFGSHRRPKPEFEVMCVEYAYVEQVDQGPKNNSKRSSATNTRKPGCTRCDPNIGVDSELEVTFNKNHELEEVGRTVQPLYVWIQDRANKNLGLPSTFDPGN